ncbi:uncharacterized protein MELLADRAFT_111379 [Melampsora larici-populina 98AG31]|uniref:Zn(2)-C6 fungal-type domain-containing protein n=1 Tax=Melampsora larici-populina (strain 98AG31 / pathotype 3-4-7) TaxID=747676 RepID=F4S305_MELLP|nr:uncharacterized protein MELLADRAFT_111379 [Melampsora larici-populina 98AG31]EGG00988.1 hypothetical protein MELLADRAFT_111379 [Melampsora larici-populina 98AG31]
MKEVMGKDQDGSNKSTRTTRACLHCRRQKMRCEGSDNPPCKRCKNNMLDCVFERRTDYLLNPEDKAWQMKMEEKVNSLTKSVDQLFLLINTLRPTPSPSSINVPSDLQDQPPPVSLQTNVYSYHQNHSELNHQPSQLTDHDFFHQLHLGLSFLPIGHGTHSGLSSHPTTSQKPQHSEESFHQLHGDSFRPNLDPGIGPETRSDHSNNNLPFSFVQDRYRTQIPIFSLMPNPNSSPTELTAWANTIHPFVSSVILTHGSSHHPSPRSAALFRPLLKESEHLFQDLVGLIGDSVNPDPSNVIFWTDAGTPMGYKIVLSMCVATIYLSTPGTPYRFLAPSHILYLLRCPALFNAYNDVFEPDQRIQSNSPGATDPHQPTALARYTLFIWLYMIFCHFSQHDLILPDDISCSRSITDMRKLLDLKDMGSDFNKLHILCAHAELVGLHHWSRKKWKFETEWNLNDSTGDNLMDFHSLNSSLALWSSRFEETRARLKDWNETWYPTLAFHHALSFPDSNDLLAARVPPIRSGTEPRGHGYLSRMIWMHYEAKQTANYASALFRLPPDPNSWPVNENLYRIAFEGVRKSCFLLQCFIGEEPIRDQSQFPISAPKLAPWQSSTEAESSTTNKSIPTGSRGQKRMREDCADKLKRGTTIDLRDYLATCPVSIQRYPIPFAGVILKAIHLKHALGIARAEMKLEGIGQRKIFDELDVEAAFDLLERVIHVCAVAGLDSNHPVSPTASELAKMVSIARRFTTGMTTGNLNLSGSNLDLR